VRIRKKTVADIVTEVSTKMSDPNYSAVMIGGFVQEQQPTSQYISAHEAELGGTEAVMNAIFHAAVIGVCYQRTHNRSVPKMEFKDLDHVSGGDTSERLKELQPAVYEYIESNVDSTVVKTILYLIALAMDWAA